MHNHARKEEGIEPRKGAVETSDETPCKCKEEVTGIVNLACISVPAIRQETVSSFGLDGAWVDNCLPWKLREGFTVSESTPLLGTESVLLGIGSVPDPVDKEVRGEEDSEELSTVWIVDDCVEVVSQIKSAMAIRQRYAGQVPEDQHETPFLVVHVPAQALVNSKVNVRRPRTM